MINEKCIHTKNCRRYDSEECTSLCVRYLKLDWIFSNSLLLPEQFKNKILILDSDESDKEAFDILVDIEKNISEFINTGDNLYIYSNVPGNGKTSWALKLMRAYFYSIWHYCDLVPKALFINVPRYLLELKSNISKHSDYIEFVNEHVYNVDLVVWDDVATKTATEFEHEHLLSIIDYRMLNNKSNIFTSNQKPNKVHNLIGQRLSSRIIKKSRVLEFKGKDKRGVEIKC